MARADQAPCRFLVTLIILALFLVALPSQAATLLSLEISQLSYQFEPGDITPPSEYAAFEIVYETGPVPQFLNVQATIPGSGLDPVWIVRNLYLRDSSTLPPSEMLSEQFFLDELGVSAGTEVTDILIGYTLADTPLLDEDFESWSISTPANQVVAVKQKTVTQGTKQDAPEEEPTTPVPTERHGTHTAPATVEVYAQRGCQVPNIDLDSGGTTTNEAWNGCMPASCTNSLHWLRDQHDQINFPSDLKDTFSQLSRLMDRNSVKKGSYTGYQGVWGHDAARAKMDFAEAYGLPLKVKYQDAWHHGNVKSTSGVYTAGDSNKTGGYPTKEWIAQELAHGEDVEISVHWKYNKGGTTKWDGAHALVLTGMGKTAGKTWIRWKDDKDQSKTAADSLRHGNSDVLDPSGEIHLPGLDQPVRDPDDHNLYPGKAIITNVLSESYDPYAYAPPAGTFMDNYCKSVTRTIPKGGKLEVTYPDDQNRCYNSQVYILDRTVVVPDPAHPGDTMTQPTWTLVHGWNFNKGKTRTYVNPYPYPISVKVHNDDHAGTTTPYPGFLLRTAIIQPSSSKADFDDPSNWEEYGGFSLGVDDSSWAEFSPFDLGTTVDIGPIVDGFTLTQVPSHLGDLVGTHDLWVRTDVNVFNEYWEHLGLLVDVADLVQPGDLFIDCPSTGYNGVLNIPASGRYELDLGIFGGGQPQFELHLTAQSGLDMYLDCLGVPSLVEGIPVDAPPAVPKRSFLQPNHPNPFNPQTTIHFGVARAGEVSLAVYDLRGRKVRTLFEGFHESGSFDAVWDGRDDAGRPVVSGSYVCRLKTDDESLSQKMTLVR